MALNQRGITRFGERVGAWFQEAARAATEVLTSIVDLKEEDDLREKGVKSADWMTRRVAYFAMDHGINIVHLSIAVTMKAYGFSLLAMFGVLWAVDFVVAGFFVAFYEKTGKDLSPGVDFRLIVETMKRKSKILGFLAMIGANALAIVWTGPEQVVAYYRKEIGTTERLITTLIVLTAVQAFLWAALYSYAYDFVMKYL